VGGSAGAASYPQEGAAPPPQQQNANPCAQHMEDFMQCAKNSSGDLNLCYAFNEALKDCRKQYGGYYYYCY